MLYIYTGVNALIAYVAVLLYWNDSSLLSLYSFMQMTLYTVCLNHTISYN